MKKSGLKILCCLISVIILKGCYRETAPSGRTIRFETCFTEIDRTRVTTDALFNSSWEDGDEIGIFAVRRESGFPASLQETGNYIHNVKLTFAGGSWSHNSSTPLVFPSGGDLLDFYAYHPYDANDGNPQALNPTVIPFNVNIDQNTVSNINGEDKSNYGLSDLLTAVSAGVTISTEPVLLTFSHALSLVQVDITNKDANLPEYQADKLTVTLNGIKVAAILDLSAEAGPAVELAQSNNTIPEITMARIADAGENKWIYRALVPPQTISPGVLFRFRQESDAIPGVSSPDEFDLKYTATSAKAITAGNTVKYEIELVMQ